MDESHSGGGNEGQARHAGAELSSDAINHAAADEAIYEISPDHPERVRQANEYRFVFCHHTMENVEEIAKALVGCDVIAIETVNLTAVQRAADEAFYNQYLGIAADPTGRASVDEYAKTYDPFIVEILSRLAEHGAQRVVLTDANRDDPEFQTLDQQRKDASMTYYRALAAKPSAELRPLQESQLRARAASVRYREGLLDRQYEQIVLDNDPQTHHLNGVVAGAGHTDVEGMRASAGYRTENVFVGQTTPDGAFNYSYADRAVRLLASNPNQEIPSELMDRILLANLYDEVKALAPGQADLTDEEYSRHVKEVHEVVERMSDDEVARLIAKTDVIKILPLEQRVPSLKAELHENALMYGWSNLGIEA